MANSLDLASRAADAAQASAIAANTHATAAEEANKINRDLLIATQRPWISVKIGDQRNAESGANIPLRFILKNIGRTPAVRVWPHARPVLGGDGLDLAQSLRAFFEEVKGPNISCHSRDRAHHFSER